jgi:hypothetical protein
MKGFIENFNKETQEIEYIPCDHDTKGYNNSYISYGNNNWILEVRIDYCNVCGQILKTELL